MHHWFCYLEIQRYISFWCGHVVIWISVKYYWVGNNKLIWTFVTKQRHWLNEWMSWDTLVHGCRDKDVLAPSSKCSMSFHSTNDFSKDNTNLLHKIRCSTLFEVCFIVSKHQNKNNIGWISYHVCDYECRNYVHGKLLLLWDVILCNLLMFS